MQTPDHSPEMAPPDLTWHRLYVRNSMRVIELLDEIQNHPGMQHAEDLGDWVETVATLMSFRPNTRDDIELEVRAEMAKLPGYKRETSTSRRVDG